MKIVLNFVSLSDILRQCMIMAKALEATLHRIKLIRCFGLSTSLQSFIDFHGPRRHLYAWSVLYFLCGLLLGRHFVCYPSTTGIVVEARSSLLHGVQPTNTSSLEELEKYFYREVERLHLRCDAIERFGSYFDGGWDVCLATFVKPTVSDCLVYSFGVEYNFGYDEQIARRFQCMIRAFDPSMGIGSHIHQPGPIHFYNIGLAGSNTVWKDMFERSPHEFNKLTKVEWQMRTLDTLMEKIGDKDKIIDILKIDIEYSEWEVFEQLLTTGILERVKILMFEVHTRELMTVRATKNDYLRYLKVLRGIEKIGFRKYRSHANRLGIGAITKARRKKNQDWDFKSRFSQKTCCYELYYVNLRFSL